MDPNANRSTNDGLTAGAFASIESPDTCTGGSREQRLEPSQAVTTSDSWLIVLGICHRPTATDLGDRGSDLSQPTLPDYPKTSSDNFKTYTLNTAKMQKLCPVFCAGSCSTTEEMNDVYDATAKRCILLH